MKNYFLVNPKASALIAVFTCNDNNSVEVSAALGIIDMKYREKMNLEDARNFYRELVKKGWVKSDSNGSNKFKCHEYVWNLYR